MNPPKLLLVDDDEVFARVLGRSLQRRGFDVLQAANSQSALCAAQDQQPTYALVDLKIGNESGLELIPQLLQALPECKIVVLTGYASIATAIEAIKLGATYYLAKPLDADMVIEALEKAEPDDHLALSGKRLSVRQLEWEHIQQVLATNSGNISATARSLRMHRRTLQRKLAKFAARS